MKDYRHIESSSSYSYSHHSLKDRIEKNEFVKQIRDKLKKSKLDKRFEQKVE